MNIFIYIFNNNCANENNAQVFSADNFSVEVLVMIFPSRVATRDNGGNLHWGCIDFESSHPSLKQFQSRQLYTTSEQTHRK